MFYYFYAPGDYFKKLFRLSTLDLYGFDKKVFSCIFIENIFQRKLYREMFYKNLEFSTEKNFISSLAEDDLKNSKICVTRIFFYQSQKHRKVNYVLKITKKTT